MLERGHVYHARICTVLLSYGMHATVIVHRTLTSHLPICVSNELKLQQQSAVNPQPLTGHRHCSSTYTEAGPGHQHSRVMTGTGLSSTPALLLAE